jgi:hypothetical protein
MSVRIMLLALLTIAVLPAGCRKKEEPAPAPANAPAAQARPEAAGKAEPTVPAEQPPAEPQVAAKAPEPAKDPYRSDAQLKKLGAEYIHLGSLGEGIGPPTPPIGRDEQVFAGDLVQWKELPVDEVREDGAPPKTFPTPLDAALDTVTVKNMGEVLFELAASGDTELVISKYMMPEYEYMQYLSQKGFPETRLVVEKLQERFKKQVAEQAPRYGKLVRSVKREDRIDGFLVDGYARQAKWTFEFEDKQGRQQTGCYVFMLVGNGWQVIDLEGVEEPWAEFKDLVAPPPDKVTPLEAPEKPAEGPEKGPDAVAPPEGPPAAEPGGPGGPAQPLPLDPGVGVKDPEKAGGDDAR